jgi:hypothetical protein
LTGRVDLIERLGETGFAHIVLSTGNTLIVEIRGEPPATAATNCRIALDAARIHVFNEAGANITTAPTTAKK